MVSTSVTYTAFAGYIIASGYPDSGMIFVLIGVYLLSSGAAAFNHYLERKTDLLMTRTKNRPLPSGRISNRFALLFALFCSISGSLLLFFNAGWLVLLLGIFNLVWYDFVYTPLKRTTVWAVFIGTITGIVPFYMGYLAALHQLPDPRANFIAVFLLIWQIPHFFMLLGIYGKEYELAGLASITKKTKEPNLFRLAALWLIACCILAFSFPVFRIMHFNSTAYVIVGISALVFIITLINLVFDHRKKYKLLFVLSNVMQLLIITSLVFDSLMQMGM